VNHEEEKGREGFAEICFKLGIKEWVGDGIPNNSNKLIIVVLGRVGFKFYHFHWVGLGWVSQLMGWVGFGHIKWTHGQLCTELTLPCLVMIIGKPLDEISRLWTRNKVDPEIEHCCVRVLHATLLNLLTWYLLTRCVHWSRASRVTTWLAAAKLERLVLSQFVRCGHSHRNTRVQDWSSVQFMGCEQAFSV